MPSLIILSATGLAVTYIFLRAVAYMLEDPREPKTITGTVPFISPLLGLLIEKSGFYIRMRDKYNLPIYTLRMPGSPIYVANSLALCQRIDRHILTVAFSPIQIRACDKAMGVSKAGMRKIANDRRLEEDGYFRSFPRVSAVAASPGPALDALNRTAIITFAASFDQLAKKGSSNVDLYKWISREIFAATTEAMYGSGNPFRRPENVKAWFNDYEPSIMALLMDVFPGIFARKGLKARDRLAEELNQYLEQNKDEEGSLFVQVRRKHNTAFGLDTKDSAHIEVGQVAAGIVNTAPTAFWLTWKVFSDPVVLADCRREAEQLVHRQDNLCTIDLSQVRSACPILVSTWQEVLRFYGISISARVIQEDTLVDNEFLLKKGGVLLIPNAAIHSDKSIWGPSADVFNHKRFLKSQVDGVARHPAAAFRGFGSGHVLCPGRHFASTEVLAFLALTLVRFDISPRGGKWIMPKKDMAMDRACPLPLSHTDVELRPRHNVSWHVVFSGSNEGINILAEDLAGDEI
ncbi:Cytochrome P450 monooxygenase nodJ [Paramyrothecium foliicola]|nr:Cytochrome P450 monooxygenase nodJ [Paramyrothecium foliicola]